MATIASDPGLQVVLGDYKEAHFTPVGYGGRRIEISVRVWKGKANTFWASSRFELGVTNSQALNSAEDFRRRLESRSLLRKFDSSTAVPYQPPLPVKK